MRLKLERRKVEVVDFFEKKGPSFLLLRLELRVLMMREKCRPCDRGEGWRVRKWERGGKGGWWVGEERRREGVGSELDFQVIVCTKIRRKRSRAKFFFMTRTFFGGHELGWETKRLRG